MIPKLVCYRHQCRYVRFTLITTGVSGVEPEETLTVVGRYTPLTFFPTWEIWSNDPINPDVASGIARQPDYERNQALKLERPQILSWGEVYYSSQPCGFSIRSTLTALYGWELAGAASQLWIAYPKSLINSDSFS